MWRFKCPNGSFNLKQWKVLNDQVREYHDGSKDHWKPNGCYSLTTRQNVQLFGIRLENLPRHWKALRDAGELRCECPSGFAQLSGLCAER
jgi:sulfite reductase beta subunit-like hemoprotein